MRKVLLMLVTLGFLAGGCGGGSDSDEAATTTAAPTTTTLPPFDPNRPDPVLVPVAGYQYVDLPPALLPS